MEKAKCFGDDTVYDQLSRMENPAAMKGLGNTIRGFDASTWHKECTKVLVPGLMSKFEQNKVCLQALLNTGDRKLGEATKEDPWGIGMQLSNPEVLNTKYWQNKSNIMGRVLEEIRDALRKKHAHDGTTSPSTSPQQ